MSSVTMFCRKAFKKKRALWNGHAIHFDLRGKTLIISRRIVPDDFQIIYIYLMLFVFNCLPSDLNISAVVFSHRWNFRGDKAERVWSRRDEQRIQNRLLTAWFGVKFVLHVRKKNIERYRRFNRVRTSGGRIYFFCAANLHALISDLQFKREKEETAKITIWRSSSDTGNLFAFASLIALRLSHPYGNVTRSVADSRGSVTMTAYRFFNNYFVRSASAIDGSGPSSILMQKRRCTTDNWFFG